MQPTYNIVGSDGQTYGPVSLDEIKAWIREGRVSHETQVSRSDQNAWCPAASFYELGFSPVQPAAMATGQAGQTIPLPLPPTTVSPVELEDLERRIKHGSSWFYWIAGLTAINSILVLFSNAGGFALGLGLTLIIDAAGQAAGGMGVAVALVLDLLAVALFIFLGVFSGRKRGWAFLVGMIIYSLDSVIFILAKDFIGIGIHALALWYIFNGFRAAGTWKKAQTGQ